jgi:hypothetical protein
MVSVRSLGMIGGTVLVALGAGQYMQSGADGSAAAMMTPQRAPELTPRPLRLAAGTPLVGYQIQPVAVTRAETTPETPVLPAKTPAGDGDCPISLDLFADADAMLSLSLLAPCHPNEGVVLRHAGLSVTYQTTATGSLFVDIPALDMSGEVTLRFLDSSEISASAEVPELSELRRFALQWVDGDSFSLSTNAPVMILGTVATALPMYALVATLPSEDTPLAIEVPVTTASCGREALGAAYFSEGGRLSVADLSMAMPECDAGGGFVVLNNPIADMKLAAAE